MWNYIKHHVKGFWQGFVGSGFILAPIILRIKIDLPPDIAAILKLFWIGCGMVVAGFLKVLGEDLWKTVLSKYFWRLMYAIKDIFIKPKNKDNGTGRYKNNGRAA